jgi:hypothetical protein
LHDTLAQPLHAHNSLIHLGELLLKPHCHIWHLVVALCIDLLSGRCDVPFVATLADDRKLSPATVIDAEALELF